jgi:uncharacterized membrane protein
MDSPFRVDTRRLVISLLFVVIVLAAWTERANAHKASLKPSKAAREGIVDSSSTAAATRDDSSESSPEFVLKPWRALRSHLHNKVIHVPIGFAMSAFLLSILAFRWPELHPAIRWLVLVAALGSVAAIVTGSSQATALEGSSKDWVISIHRQLAIASAGTLWIWVAVLQARRTKRWAFLVGLAAILLLLVTGFFGGVVAHG